MAADRAAEVVAEAECEVSPLDPLSEELMADVQAELERSADLEAGNVRVFLEGRRRLYAQIGEKAVAHRERDNELTGLRGLGFGRKATTESK
jgi:hypothetical protein